MEKPIDYRVDELEGPALYPVDAFISPEYARAEADRLWAKVWQHAGRVEEIPNVGDFFTYEIMDESILIVRTAPKKIKAFYNVCPHRGRRVVDTPFETNGGRGAQASKFVCNYHAWTFDLNGKNIFILDKDDWKGALTDDRINLVEVNVDTWGGWIWVNLDPNCVSLREYLEPAASMLDPFEFDKMRYKFRQFVVFDCNWKVALEAFLEPYHVASTHPQLAKYGSFRAWSKAQGLHGNDGYVTDGGGDGSSSVTTVYRTPKKGNDPRLMIAEMQREFWETIGTVTTQTLVDAADRLVKELPENVSAHEAHKHWMASAKAADAARGVVWPEITEQQLAEAGLAYHIFPNMNLLFGPTFLLYYRVRPYGDNPNKCIYEAIALERYPAGQEPKTEWAYVELTDPRWGGVIPQDFSNMVAVQQGMKSRAFRGCLPNPMQERKVSNLHRNLARYMGIGETRPIK